MGAAGTIGARGVNQDPLEGPLMPGSPAVRPTIPAELDIAPKPRKKRTRGRWTNMSDEDKRAVMRPIIDKRTADQSARRIADLIATAPPFTPEQVAKLTVLLSGHPVTSAPVARYGRHRGEMLTGLVRVAFLTGMAAFAAVVGVVACSAVCHPAGAAATAAITVIGGICAAVTGVTASAVKSVRCCGRDGVSQSAPGRESGERG
jgi:hypothetical protein